MKSLGRECSRLTVLLFVVGEGVNGWQTLLVPAAHTGVWENTFFVIGCIYDEASGKVHMPQHSAFDRPCADEVLLSRRAFGAYRTSYQDGQATYGAETWPGKAPGLGTSRSVASDERDRPEWKRCLFFSESKVLSVFFFFFLHITTFAPFVL